MKRKGLFFAMLLLACGSPAFLSTDAQWGFEAYAQSGRATGVVKDANGEPLVGATVAVKGTNRVVVTDAEGRFNINAAKGSKLVIAYVGQVTQEVTVGQDPIDVSMKSSSTDLDEVVVTALGIKKDKKSLGYAVEELNAEELMRNKSANAITSLSGKIAGVNVTQSSGAAGAGAQIILRGGTSASESRDNQPLFVVDGVIYDNSSAVVGNTGFDGLSTTNQVSSNRVMDINPEDIESMSVLKGPAAAALYGSRASGGVILITTKKGKEGKIEVNLSTKYITSWVTNLPKSQNTYGHGYYETLRDAEGNYLGERYDDFAYTSWGQKITGQTYDNIGQFYRKGGISDTNVSVSGGNKNGNFFLSGSFYDQNGVVPATGYRKSTIRFNGEQKWKIFTFGANVAYSNSRTNKTLTSGGLYGDSGSGALYSVNTWAADMNMKHWQNEDGSHVREFGDRLENWEEKANPYWIINKNKIWEDVERFTGNFNIKADLTSWWWVAFRAGVDSYTQDNHLRIAPNGFSQRAWQKGMMSDNSRRYQYISTNLMTNFNKKFGDFDFNIMLGTSTDNFNTEQKYAMGWNFEVPDFYSIQNCKKENTKFQNNLSKKRLVGVFGEFRADWKSTVFLTVTGRNDWTSTLPVQNRSYFYPSVSGSFAFSQLMKDLGAIDDTHWLTFGKVRASWARVGKDTGPYETNTSLWPVATYIGDIVGVGNNWERGNPYIKPEITQSTEIGLELHMFQGRLKFDYAFYTNDSFNQILSPRGPQSTGYIFCSINAGDVYNKGMELSISGTPIRTKDWEWETGINMAGNRGKLKNLPSGVSVMYLTDVQYGTAKAASFNDGTYMAIQGTRWQRDPKGNIVLDDNNMPVANSSAAVEVGDRECTLTGGWNNTVTFKDFTFNMLWEFRFGGAVFNGTRYVMDQAGTSKFSADNREFLQVTGVHQTGKDAEGNPTYSDPETYTFEAGKTYTYDKKTYSGRYIIQNYYTSKYPNETANYVTNVNSFRLRAISLAYSLPKSLLAKTKVIKRAVVTASANNIALFTNYDGDPEVAAAGAGRGGSSSVGFDYCGVPATASFAFGINLTF